MTVPTLPTAPSPTDTQAAFNVNAFAFCAALSAWGVAINSTAADVNGYVVSALAYANASAGSAAASAASAVSSANAQAAAYAGANFKGNWSSLTGALNIPASVRHASRTWILVNNLANVTTSQPGVTSDWIPLDTSALPVVLMSSNTTGVVGVHYIFTVGGITLTLPTAGLLANDPIEFTNASNTVTGFVDFVTTKFRGQASPGVMLLDNLSAKAKLQYSGNATQGWA